MSHFRGELVAGAWCNSVTGQQFMVDNVHNQAATLAAQAEALRAQRTAEADNTILRAARMQALAAQLGGVPIQHA